MNRSELLKAALSAEALRRRVSMARGNRTSRIAYLESRIASIVFIASIAHPASRIAHLP